jgi:acyl-[acyl carrier protein]--UDP-N-acetylglucosamine O-acyltransferase
LLGVRVGDRAWLVDTSAATWGSEPFLITIGDDVTVASGVHFLNHDGTVLLFRREHPNIDLVEPITVGDNVFIGLGVTIMPGVTIGSDCVIGAGAIVTRDVPAGSIAVGQPARVVSTIDAWLQKNQGRFIDLHGLPEAERRRTLLEHFGLTDDALAQTRR